MTYETLELDVDDAVATVALNRPEHLNAWTPQMAEELSGAMRQLDADDDVRAVIVTGRGNAFCAGADLSSGADAFADQEPEPDGSSLRPGPRTVFPWEIRKPVIAAINGHAIGVGVTYSMLCDVRIVAEDAKVQFAFVRRGVIPELSSHAIVPRIVGFSRAADLMLTGRPILGRELAAMGLASEALPADQVLPAARAKAQEFLLAAPVSVAISKRLLWEGLTTSVSDMARREGPLFWWAGRQADAREGVSAFLEKREPEWEMRVSTDLPHDLLEHRPFRD